jgi:CheY-like chemotaxis protein/HPt (histidine-containing phosphotransfer) domain-containing protein
MIFSIIIITAYRANQALHPETSLLSTASPAKRQERILLAGNNTVDQRVALLNLNRLGYNADVAQNGIDALNALEQRRYDVILMDCQMPDLDGYEATKEIRRRDRGGHHTWIIGVTDQTAGDRKKCLTAGMDDYVSKPLRREELRAALERSVPRPGKPFDDDALRVLVEEGDFEISELVDLFVASAPASISEMRLALEKSDLEHLVFIAHTLKGTCGNFGAAPLRELCVKIEQAGLSGDIDCSADLILSAERELDRLIGALESYRDTVQGG